MNEGHWREQEAALQREIRETLAPLNVNEPLPAGLAARLRDSVRGEANRLRHGRRWLAWRGAIGAAAAAIGLALLPMAPQRPTTPAGVTSAEVWLDNWAQAVDDSLAELSFVVNEDAAAASEPVDPLEWIERWDTGIGESLEALESWYEV